MRVEPKAAGIETLIQEFVRSLAGGLWAYDYFSPEVSAKLGEYGYIKTAAAGEHFVRLGRLDDLFDRPTLSTHVYQHTGIGNVTTMWRVVEGWPHRIFR